MAYHPNEFALAPGEEVVGSFGHFAPAPDPLPGFPDIDSSGPVVGVHVGKVTLSACLTSHLPYPFLRRSAPRHCDGVLLLPVRQAQHVLLHQGGVEVVGGDGDAGSPDGPHAGCQQRVEEPVRSRDEGKVPLDGWRLL